jgi:hypothetical protein
MQTFPVWPVESVAVAALAMFHDPASTPSGGKRYREPALSGIDRQFGHVGASLATTWR